jgi:hypothetical protein
MQFVGALGSSIDAWTHIPSWHCPVVPIVAAAERVSDRDCPLELRAA